MSGIGFLAAFAAGLLSFLSPCVLPLIPAYLSMVSGYAVSELRSGSGRLRTTSRSLAFSAGLTLLFCAMGLAFSGASLLLAPYARALSIASGILVALLGLNLAFDFIKALNAEWKPGGSRIGRGYGGAFLLGLAFGAGWTPCVGPILASILLLAAQEGKPAHSAALLFAYSGGLALPFVAAGLFLDRLTPLMDWFKRRAKAVRLLSGALLVAIGATMAAGKLGAISGAAGAWGASLAAAVDARPAAARAVAAAAWLLLAAAIAARPAIEALRVRRNRVVGPRSPSQGERRRLRARLAVAAALATFALGDIIGLWSTASLLASWLSFQGR